MKNRKKQLPTVRTLASLVLLIFMIYLSLERLKALLLKFENPKRLRQGGLAIWRDERTRADLVFRWHQWLQLARIQNMWANFMALFSRAGSVSSSRVFCALPNSSARFSTFSAQPDRWLPVTHGRTLGWSPLPSLSLQVFRSFFVPLSLHPFQRHQRHQETTNRHFRRQEA